MHCCAQWTYFASTARRARVNEHCAQQDSHKLSQANILSQPSDQSSSPFASCAASTRRPVSWSACLLWSPPTKDCLWPNFAAAPLSVQPISKLNRMADMPGELEQARVKPDRRAGAFEDGTAQIVVDHGARDALNPEAAPRIAPTRTCERDAGRWTSCPDCQSVFDDYGKAVNPIPEFRGHPLGAAIGVSELRRLDDFWGRRQHIKHTLHVRLV
jgi:hypothetical protein